MLKIKKGATCVYNWNLKIKYVSLKTIFYDKKKTVLFFRMVLPKQKKKKKKPQSMFNLHDPGGINI